MTEDEQPQEAEQAEAVTQEAADEAPATTPGTQPMPSSWKADEAAEVGRSDRSKRLTLIAACVVGVLVVALGALAIIRPFDSEEKEQVWPLDVGGRPAGLGDTGELAEAVTPDVAPGVYLWNDFDGWHLWFVFDGSFHEVKGTITSTADLTKSLLTPASIGTVKAKGDTLTFDISTETNANIAGIDFEPGFFADRFEIAIEAPDGTLRADMVHKGRDMAVVDLPIVIEKVDAPDDAEADTGN